MAIRPAPSAATPPPTTTHGPLWKRALSRSAGSSPGDAPPDGPGMVETPEARALALPLWSGPAFGDSPALWLAFGAAELAGVATGVGPGV